MMPPTREPREITTPARDGYPLAATIFGGIEEPSRVVVISSATAVPQRFYRHYAAATADAGLKSIGHLGFFRPQSEALWAEAHAWFDRC